MGEDKVEKFNDGMIKEEDYLPIFEKQAHKVEAFNIFDVIIQDKKTKENLKQGWLKYVICNFHETTAWPESSSAQTMKRLGYKENDKYIYVPAFFPNEEREQKSLPPVQGLGKKALEEISIRGRAQGARGIFVVPSTTLFNALLEREGFEPLEIKNKEDKSYIFDDKIYITYHKLLKE